MGKFYEGPYARKCRRRGARCVRKNSPRRCACVPETQPTFINKREMRGIKNWRKTAKPYNLPKVCGKVKRGKLVKHKQGNYYATKTYLQRTKYSLKQFKKKVMSKKLNCAK